jgi:transposase
VRAENADSRPRQVSGYLANRTGDGDIPRIAPVADVAADREKRARKVARLYASGLSVREAARKAGIHHQTALDDLARLDRGTFGAYRRKLDKRHRAAKDKRMGRAVELRADGASLRTIAAELGVSHQTVANDLARWQREHPNVVALSNPGVQKMPPGTMDYAPEFDSAAIVPLTRKRQEMARQLAPVGAK